MNEFYLVESSLGIATGLQGIYKHNIDKLRSHNTGAASKY